MKSLKTSDNPDSKYDVIIVGAGPGGSSCAAWLADSGRKVLMLDKEHFPRDKTCGDGISGKSVRMLSELNLICDIENTPHSTMTGIIFSSPEGSVVQVPLPAMAGEVSSGYCIRRELFDDVLFQNARRLTAKTIEGFTVTELIKEVDCGHDRVIGVNGRDREGRDQSFYADIVVGADGANSTIARFVGARTLDYAHISTGLRCYVRGVKGLSGNIEMHFLDEVHPGYLWIFPVDDGFANVGVVMVTANIISKKVKLRDALSRAMKENPLIKDRFKESEVIPGTLKGWVMPLGSKRGRVHGNGWLLVGDAASLVDPFTGEGIGNALLSSRLAANVILEAFKVGVFDEDQLMGYDSAIEEALGEELKDSFVMLRRGESRFLLNLFIRKASKNQEVKEMMTRNIVDSKSRKSYNSALTYLRILLSPPYW